MYRYHYVRRSAPHLEMLAFVYLENIWTSCIDQVDSNKEFCNIQNRSRRSNQQHGTRLVLIEFDVGDSIFSHSVYPHWYGNWGGSRGAASCGWGRGFIGLNTFKTWLGGVRHLHTEP